MTNILSVFLGIIRFGVPENKKSYGGPISWFISLNLFGIYSKIFFHYALNLMQKKLFWIMTIIFGKISPEFVFNVLQAKGSSTVKNLLHNENCVSPYVCL